MKRLQDTPFRIDIADTLAISAAVTVKIDVRVLANEGFSNG